jgi:hypothetical protein
VEVVWAADRKRRAEIIRRDDGLFQIFLAREVPGDGEWEPDAYWAPVGRDALLTDTLERAMSPRRGGASAHGRLTAMPTPYPAARSAVGRRRRSVVVIAGVL